MMSRRELPPWPGACRGWQDDVARQGQAAELDVVRLGSDQVKFDIALLEWVAERRLRRRK